MAKKIPTHQPRRRTATDRVKASPKRLTGGGTPEKVIQKSILDWLKSQGFLYWRQNSGVVFAGGRMVKLGEEGLPDIVVVVPPNGRILGLEVKSAKGTLRDSQREFMQRLAEVGGHYRVVRSLSEARDAVAFTIGEEKWRQMHLSHTKEGPGCSE